MKILDVIWEIIDNTLYVMHVVAVVLVALAAIACPVFLQQIRDELSIIRECAQKDVTVIDVHPGPVLPRVLPRLRRIGEEAPE